MPVPDPDPGDLKHGDCDSGGGDDCVAHQGVAHGPVPGVGHGAVQEGGALPLHSHVDGEPARKLGDKVARTEKKRARIVVSCSMLPMLTWAGICWTGAGGWRSSLWRAG